MSSRYILCLKAFSFKYEPSGALERYVMILDIAFIILCVAEYVILGIIAEKHHWCG